MSDKPSIPTTSLDDSDLPMGDPARRGSFEGLVAALEETADRNHVLPDISRAALRAGALVRSMRKESGLSQRALADRLGVSQARISEIEAGIGAQGPTWAVMERITAACGNFITVAPVAVGAESIDDYAAFDRA